MRRTLADRQPPAPAAGGPSPEEERRLDAELEQRKASETAMMETELTQVWGPPAVPPPALCLCRRSNRSTR